MSSRARSLVSNSSFAATLHPWIAPTSVLNGGIFFGYQLGTGRPAFLDVHGLMRQGILSSTVVDINGPKNHGKGTLAKSITIRESGQQAGVNESTGWPRRVKVQINDRKHEGGRAEYAAVTEFLLSDVVELAKIGQFNLFDLTMDLSVQDVCRTAVDVQTDAKGARLDADEVMVTLMASYYMVRHQHEVSSGPAFERILRGFNAGIMQCFDADTDQELRATLIQFLGRKPGADVVVNQLVDLPSNLVSPRFNDGYRQAALRCSGYLNDVLRTGRYGTMFAGTKSLSEYIQGDDILTLDWTGLPSMGADLLDGMLSLWMLNAATDADSLLLPNIRISEEEGSAMTSLVHSRNKAELYRKSRAVPTAYYSITQSPMDYWNLGDEGSDLRAHGRTIARSFGMRIFGQQASDAETLSYITSLGVSDADAYRMTKLPQGCWAIFTPGQPVDYVQHVLLPDEWPLIESNSANKRATTRVQVSTLPEVQNRIEQLRAYKIGEQ